MKTFWKFQILYKKVVKKSREGRIKMQPIYPNKANVREPCKGPPHLSWDWRHQMVKKYVPTKDGINFNSLDLFLEKNFHGSPKKMAKNWEYTQNLKIWAKISNFVIFELFHHAIPQKNAFFLQFNFEQKSMVYLKKKIEKQFFIFFCQNLCWPGVFNPKFFKFVQRNLETELFCAMKSFWN